MKLLNFTIIKLTFFLIIGISIASVIKVSVTASILVSCFLISILGFSFLIAKNKFRKTIGFGSSAFLTTISLGILVYNLHNQSTFKNHYLNSINPESQHVTFKVKKQLKPSNYHNKYIIEVLKINNQSVSGKSLLNILKDSTQNALKVDDIIFTFSEFKPINHALNPNQFDYKNYLEKQYIYKQLTTKTNKLYKVKSQRTTIYGFAEALRTQINSKLKAYNFKESELSIINALLLGQRQDISKDIYNNYTNAGAVHILAVSGLHVGIILLLLNFVLKPIEWFKNGKTFKVILILILLWSFAIIAGLSASVTRAVTMFSVVAIAMHLKRPTNIYNTLAISILILLLFKPMFLFDVGFQMSYLAVIAIVSIQPLLYKLCKPKLLLVDYFWKLFTVTLAAQFGVIPISLYYFHQFPGLFFVSNLAIIPFLGLILGLGIFIIILALLNCLPEILATIYGSIISWMNETVAWISQQEQFLFKEIAFNLPLVIASYFLIFASTKFYTKRTYSHLSFFLISILTLQGVFIYNKRQNSTNEFTVFHKSRYSLLAQKTNSKLSIFSNLDSVAKQKDKVISNFKTGNFISEVDESSIESIYTINNKLLLVIDSLGVYNTRSFRPHYVLLRNSPRLNLQRMIDSLQPKHIIADGSNYKSYVKRWKQTCIKQKLPFHQTNKKGAFIISN
ncbi:ComEC/Rec2 family competence protein [Ichthyenterobacterium magnum]|uniref:Competence protein ComEC n=1 Tax=Ichthyenterobacterium magnum TaxID=1230530 RepID=A0A420DVX0_9FLAO|nr:ComEC/Rec2 family competence protein [Ichthyenterobacterium magnum]RKE98378.1 competence protein ComEC [Ichthyenterobacterium magnum]